MNNLYQTSLETEQQCEQIAALAGAYYHSGLVDLELIGAWVVDGESFATAQELCLFKGWV